MNHGTFSLAATTNDLTQEQAIRGIADAVEFRMDKAKAPIDQLETYDGALPLIATNRAEWAGGATTDEGRLEALQTVAQMDAVEIVDIEIEAVRENDEILEPFRNLDVDLLVSYHNFESTPDQETLTSIVEECAAAGDIAKVAALANDRTDTLRMLNAISTATEAGIQMAGISMGEIGSHTRVVGPIYGSVIGYAPLESDSTEYAPGQIPLERLRELVAELQDPRY